MARKSRTQVASPVGTYSFKAVVNHVHAEGIETLQTARLHITHDLARVMANSLFLAWHRYLAKSQMSQQHRVPQPTDLAAN